MFFLWPWLRSQVMYHVTFSNDVVALIGIMELLHLHPTENAATPTLSPSTKEKCKKQSPQPGTSNRQLDVSRSVELSVLVKDKKDKNQEEIEKKEEIMEDDSFTVV